MARPLGSFNRRINLPSHLKDWQVRKPQRMASLKLDIIPFERGKTTGSEKFSKGRERSRQQQPENQRFAGAIVNSNLLPEGTEQTGQNVRVTSGMQAAFAPSLPGVAEMRKQT